MLFFRRQIQDALNQQTYHQFKTYAEQQFPDNPEQVNDRNNFAMYGD